MYLFIYTLNLNGLTFLMNTKDLLFITIEKRTMFLKPIHTYDKVISPKGGGIHFDLCNTHPNIYNTIVDTKSYYLFYLSSEFDWVEIIVFVGWRIKVVNSTKIKQNYEFIIDFT